MCDFATELFKVHSKYQGAFLKQNSGFCYRCFKKSTDFNYMGSRYLVKIVGLTTTRTHVRYNLNVAGNG